MVVVEFRSNVTNYAHMWGWFSEAPIYRKLRYWNIYKRGCCVGLEYSDLHSWEFYPRLPPRHLCCSLCLTATRGHMAGKRVIRVKGF